MVLWIKKHQDILISIVISILFIFPFLIRDFVGIEHDTYFHFSRITGLAQSILEGDFFPAIYPYKNNGFGYASPLFYNDILLVVPALLYIAGLSLSRCYILVIFIASIASAFAMIQCMRRFVKDSTICWIIAFVYLFNNYRITDVYVRSAIGEVMAFTFLPILIMGLYDLLEKHKETSWKYIAISLVGLICCHNLTFVLGVFLIILFTLIYIPSLSQKQFLCICKAAIIAFLLTAWFTLPMIEQTLSQNLYLHFYASYSDLGTSSLPLWKYFANTTVFGYGSNQLPKDMSMLLNVGYFLTFIPLLYFFVPKKNKFVLRCLIFGYLALLLPINIIPWSQIHFLNILQFIWRTLTIASPLLCIVSGVSLNYIIHSNRHIKYLVICALLLEGIYHLYPVTQRTFGITSKTTYQDILDGKYSDPYYSATYMRVELAGGDYLPLDSVDFKTISTQIKDIYMNDLTIPYEKQGTSLSFYIDQSGEYILPITWYKGYQLYQVIDDQWIKQAIPTSTNGLVHIQINESGNYVLKYENTLCRTFSFILSSITIILLILRKRKTSSRQF